MDTLLREPDDIIRELSARTHGEPEPAERQVEVAGANTTDETTPTYLHPMVVAATAAGYAWLLLAFWAAFSGYGYMTLSLIIATMISGAMLGLMVGGVVAGRDVTPWQRRWQSFREFLDGEVEVWGARVSGRDAFIQLAGMSWLLAALATVFAIITVAVRTT